MPCKFKVDVTVRKKLALIERCVPVRSAIDFGGMWEVDGYYSRQCLTRFGIKSVTMIDTYESESWKTDPSLREGINFRRGDFSNSKFMHSIRPRSYDLGIAFDVIPHQIDFRRALAMLISKTRRFFLISNPVILDSIMPYRNSLVLLSGSRSSDLIPFHEQWTKEIDYWRNFRDASNVSTNHWVWGMSPSLIECMMIGLGWRLIHREIWKDPFLQNPRWRMGGFVFANRTQRRGSCQELAHRA